jgi:hypothetical protein
MWWWWVLLVPLAGMLLVALGLFAAGVWIVLREE